MKKIDCDGIIFDIDGVLIDVTKSFRKVCKITARYVLKNKYNRTVNVTDEDVKEMKSIPGFNNDWDLSFALTKLFLSGITRKDFKTKVFKVSDKVKQSTEYLEIRDVFETFYWGSEIFPDLRKKNAPFIFKKGLVNNESLLINRHLLKLLAKKYKLGIASGRTKFETLFAFKKFKILDFFPEKYLVTDDDTTLKKPNPAPLLEAKKRMEVKKPIYIGDTVNDVLAAKNANMPCVYIGSEKLGDYQIKNVNQLMEVIS